ncbi:hypothetical protein ACFLY6_01365 [Candidatus Dependentiae bacterium]
MQKNLSLAFVAALLSAQFMNVICSDSKRKEDLAGDVASEFLQSFVFFEFLIVR